MSALEPGEIDQAIPSRTWTRVQGTDIEVKHVSGALRTVRRIGDQVILSGHDPWAVRVVKP